MNINRDNYEEYFLLYADNELTDSEKAEVLMFVKNNKDLEDEFRMIHHTISKPDANVELADKSFLFRTTKTSFINETNYEEIFVLYHDNELTEQQKLETKEFLSRHSELKNEFDLIGLARLTPESTVVFPGKKILYKKEGTRKVIPIMFWRMFAAAVFIGFGLWGTIIYFQKPSPLHETIVHTSPATNPATNVEKNIVPEKKRSENMAQSSKLTASSKEARTKDANVIKKKAVSQTNNSGTNSAKNATREQGTGEENPATVPPQKINDEMVASINKMKDISKDEISPISKIEPSKELARNAIRDQNETTLPVAGARNVAYFPDADNNNENYVFYDVTTDKFRKTKVGGFLKKVRRVVERNNPIARLFSGDEKQVASN